MLKKSYFFKAFLAGLVACLAQRGLAADGTITVAPVQVKTKHILNKALTVQFTNRGLNMFRDHLQSLLGDLGVSADEAYFNPQQWQAATATDLNQVSQDENTQKMIVAVRDALKEWFVGFPLISSLQPVVQLGPSAYHAVFNKLSLSTDQSMLRSLGKTEGAVLTLDFEVKEMDFKATQVSVWNAQTPALGKITLQSPSFKVAGKKTPLIVRIPIYVSVGPDGVPEFEALSVQQNISKVDLSYSYKSMKVPSIALVVNGVSYKMNQKALENILQKESPSIHKMLAESLDKMASTQLPKLLNDKAKQALQTSLEELKQLVAPGAVAGSAPLLWGLQLAQIEEHSDLEIQLNTFVEDPQAPDLALKLGASQVSAKMNAISSTQYDVGLVIDRAMINRMLQLSFARGNFEKIPLDGSASLKPECKPPGNQASVATGKFLKLTEMPELRALSGGGSTGKLGETFAKIHLSVQVPKGTVSGLEKLAIKDHFVMSFDMTVKLGKGPHNSILIYMWELDPASVQLSPGTLTAIGEMAFRGAVKDAILKTFQQMSAEWKCNGTTLPGSVQIPQILGINFDLKHVDMEETGNLVFYMNYGGQ